jgi:hypothetical protein
MNVFNGSEIHKFGDSAFFGAKQGNSKYLFGGSARRPSPLAGEGGLRVSEGRMRGVERGETVWG